MSNTTTTTAPITNTITNTDCLIVEEVNTAFGKKAHRLVVKFVLQPEVYASLADAKWAVTKLVLGASLNRR